MNYCCPVCLGIRHRVVGPYCQACGLAGEGSLNLGQIKEALKASGWSVQNSSEPRNRRTETMNEKTYPATVVAELALKLLDTAKIEEENRQLKMQALGLRGEINVLLIECANLKAELVLKSEKIKRALTMAVTPVSVLNLEPGPARALRRLKCVTLADVTRLDKSLAKNNKGYRLIFDAMVKYLEGR